MDEQIKKSLNVNDLEFPACPMRWTCCAECPSGDYDDNKEQVWCGHFRRWFDGSDGCSQGPNR